MRRAGLGGRLPGNYVASGYSAYEMENKHLLEGLGAKGSALKRDSDFDSMGGLLGATNGRVKQLSRGSQTKLFCYMLFFCFLVFTILYWFIKLR